MNLNKAQELFNEIVDICYSTENSRLIEIAESIYPDVDGASDVSDIISACEEIEIVINEIDILEEEEDLIDEIRQKIEEISE